MRPWIGIALALTACGDSPHPLTPDEAKVAEAGVKAWIREHGGGVVMCNAADGNSDGDVVCSGTTRDGDNIALICMYRATDRIGCKRQGNE